MQLIATFAALLLSCVLPTQSNAEPLKVVLALSEVTFPNHGEDFRVHLALSGNDVLPLRIWMEEKVSKGQWACTVTDLQNHALPGADYVLPTEVVVLGLKEGLSALDSRGNEVDSGTYEVILTVEKETHRRLVLVMRAFSALLATYEFNLSPLSLEKVDVLESRIRDLEDELELKNHMLLDILPPCIDIMGPAAIQYESLEMQNYILDLTSLLSDSIVPNLQNAVHLSLIATSIDQNDAITWTEVEEADENYFKLSADNKTIEFQASGQYLFVAVAQCTQGILQLLIDGVDRAYSGPVLSSSFVQLFDQTDIAKSAKASIHFTGSPSAQYSASLHIVRVFHPKSRLKRGKRSSPTCSSEADCRRMNQ
ncbi:Aste57867_15969 [Aphanomyces stellatus]|uniref:Aste57867_15969 protein n=1 Tax=Aphanomyces stellatus TaxID=120398 RepID=A0A485L5P5_9STRA|nr:hypothetical protein As57867_015913 [Aphanomyces stellatus]VFT92754.1 Aste57867_15969 [Aphanomyces stellatus]